jgi:hypothetical protein
MKKKSKSESKKVEKQKLLASIDVFEDSIIATRYQDGQTLRRYVNVGDVAKIFETASGKVVQWLPIMKNVIAIGTDSDGCQRYLIVRPAQRTRIEYYIGKRKFKQAIAMPNLLAELLAEKSDKGTPLFKSVEAVYAFSGQVSKLNTDTLLYVAPVPNVYGDGRICMGTVNVKRWAHQPAADVFENAFIKSPFTDHVLDGHLTDEAKKKYRNILDAIKKLKGNISIKMLKRVKTYGQIFAE